MMIPVRFFFVTAAILAGVAAGAAAPDDDATDIKAKLDLAKRVYKFEAEQYTKLIAQEFENREETARNAGDKKALTTIKSEKKAFESKGMIPPYIPLTAKRDFAAARSQMDMHYSEAVKRYLKLKLDEESEATEKEQRTFLLESGLLAGRTTYLVTLKHSDLKVEGKWFSNNGTLGISPAPLIPLRLNGVPTPHSIHMVPPPSAAGIVSYALTRKWVGFRADVGVPKIDEMTPAPATPLTFEVLGDGKSLWKSKAIDNIDESQTCQVWIQGIKTLTLRVQCPGVNSWAYSAWFEPILIEL